jgi:hypothetical protein
MAASSKPTVVHFAIVVLVLISVVCGIGWLLVYKGANSIEDLRREASNLRQQLDAAKKAETMANKLDADSAEDGKVKGSADQAGKEAGH